MTDKELSRLVKQDLQTKKSIMKNLRNLFESKSNSDKFDELNNSIKKNYREACDRLDKIKEMYEKDITTTELPE